MSEQEKGWLDEELYARAVRSLPIACVDLVVSRPKNRGDVSFDDEILMVLRKNEPLAGHWWFPGGRIHIGETRDEAARRKLKQECGLSAPLDAKWVQKRVHEIILQRADGSTSHSITTVFWVEVEALRSTVILDDQSARFAWRTARDWLLDETTELHPWVQHRLREFDQT